MLTNTVYVGRYVWRCTCRKQQQQQHWNPGINWEILYTSKQLATIRTITLKVQLVHHSQQSHASKLGCLHSWPETIQAASVRSQLRTNDLTTSTGTTNSTVPKLL